MCNIIENRVVYVYVCASVERHWIVHGFISTLKHCPVISREISYGGVISY